MTEYEDPVFHQMMAEHEEDVWSHLQGFRHDHPNERDLVMLLILHEGTLKISVAPRSYAIQSLRKIERFQQAARDIQHDPTAEPGMTCSVHILLCVGNQTILQPLYIYPEGPGGDA